MLSRVLICLLDNTWGGCAARLCNYCRLLVTDSRIVHPRIQLVQQTTPSMLENGGQRANGQPFSMRVNGFVEAMDEMKLSQASLPGPGLSILLAGLAHFYFFLILGIHIPYIFHSNRTAWCFGRSIFHFSRHI